MIRKSVHPYWGILEIAAFSALFFAGIWGIGPKVGASYALQILLWFFVIAGGVYLLWISPVKLHRYRAEDWGWTISRNKSDHLGSLKKAWPVYALFTTVAAAILAGYVFIFAPQSLYNVNPKAITLKFFGYLFYGTVQAVIFFGFILTRIRKIVSTSLKQSGKNLQMLAVILPTAAIFSLFHSPNIVLMACTLLTGLFWAWIFYVKPNLLLMGISHAILGTVLHQVVQLHMRIGPFYNNPDLYILREVVPGLKKLIGDLF